MRRGPASIHSGAAIGVPHWAQGFPWGKSSKSIFAMAHLPCCSKLFLLEMILWTGWVSEIRRHLTAYECWRALRHFNGEASCSGLQRTAPTRSGRAAQHPGHAFVFSAWRNSLRLCISRRLERMHRTGHTEMNRRDIVCKDLLPAVDVVEQFGRSALRAHQRRLDLVLIQQPEQIFRFHQPAGGVVIEKEFLAIKFGSAVDEGRDAIGDQITAE